MRRYPFAIAVEIAGETSSGDINKVPSPTFGIVEQSALFRLKVAPASAAVADAMIQGLLLGLSFDRSKVVSQEKSNTVLAKK